VGRIRVDFGPISETVYIYRYNIKHNHFLKYKMTFVVCIAWQKCTA
jgi:hypothetical protein